MSQTLFQHEISIGERQHMIRISHLIQEDVAVSGIQDGIIVVFCPHTTAGITVNEKEDPDVIRDLIYGLERSFPSNNRNYRHATGDSHAHLKSTVCGASQTIILSEGKMLLGEWQEIYFCEFDGPRDRTWYVKILEG